jgi:hypothetical protein
MTWEVGGVYISILFLSNLRCVLFIQMEMLKSQITWSSGWVQIGVRTGDKMWELSHTCAHAHTHTHTHTHVYTVMYMGLG